MLVVKSLSRLKNKEINIKSPNLVLTIEIKLRKLTFCQIALNSHCHCDVHVTQWAPKAQSTADHKDQEVPYSRIIELLT